MNSLALFTSTKAPMSILFFLFALLAGFANPFQSGTNAELNKQLNQPLWAAIVVYASGLAGLLLIQCFLRRAFPAGQEIEGVPAWAWLGGLISLVPTVIGLTVAQKMGSGLFTGAIITAALVTSVFLDQFGLVGFRQHAASPARIVGCGLMVAGLWLIARF